MPDQDVLRVLDTPANLAANLKNRMFGFDTVGNRFGVKNNSGVMKYVSEDALQCLLAGPQTLTGLKTFGAGAIVNTSFVVNSLADLKGVAKFGSEMRSDPTNTLDAGIGYVDYAIALANQIDATGKSVIAVQPSTGFDFYSFTGLTDGNIYFIRNYNSSLGAQIDSGIAGFPITIPAFELVVASSDSAFSPPFVGTE